MTLYRLDASIRTEGSHSRTLANIVEQEWQTNHPGDDVVLRHIGVDPIASTTWATAVVAAQMPSDRLSGEQHDALALAASLTDEIDAADALLFAVPLYNFGVSQHFKAFVDLVTTDPRMSPGFEPATAGKPAVLVTVRGGGYSAGTPHEGWDHATGWMRRILADVWKLELSVVDTDLTLADVIPDLAQLKPLAAQYRAAADERAHQCGRELAR